MVSARLFRQIRILALLFILLLVAGDAWLAGSRATDWDDALWVAVYPINASGSPVVRDYIARLGSGTFSAVEDFFPGQASRYGLTKTELVKIRLGPEVNALPPPPPAGNNVFAVMLWSLRLRFWAMLAGLGVDGPPADIRIYVVYHDPARQPRLAHSLGLKKGLLGVVNAYASDAYSERNNVVIAHELLHTLGATDKYDPVTDQPVYPEGYAEPGRMPLYPQYLAEVMGGRIPLSATHSEIPGSLKRAVIGRATAVEINWLERR